MLTIGLTGGYATGKSTAAGILRALGAVVVDADELSHAVIRRGEPGWRAVVDEFGTGILDPRGEIDRSALGRIVFAQPERKAALERIIHPRVMAAVRAAEAQARAEGVSVFVCEAPLLFEAGLAGEFDYVWVVSAGMDQQLERAMTRDNLPAAEARTRVGAQWPMAEKERRADLVLWNKGDLAELRRQIETAWASLKSR
ncbi:MAG: dephospho-CoA kinase [Bacteroidota bacterium]